MGFDLNYLTDQIYQGRYGAKLNANYNQQMAWYLSVCDRSIRATVGFLAAISFACAVLSSTPHIDGGIPILMNSTTSLTLSFLSLLAAMILNIIPVGLYHRQYSELYRRWNDLSGRWLLMKTMFPALKKAEYTTILQQIRDLHYEKTNIESAETAPWMKIMEKCQTRLDISLGKEIIDDK